MNARTPLPLVLIVAGYLALAAAYAVVVPPFEAPDETGHLFYVNYVATHGRLPNQNDPAQRVEGEGHQFPLYYLPAALAVRLVLADDSVDLSPRINRIPGAAAPDEPRPKFVHVGASIFDTPSDRRAFYALRAYSIALGAGTVIATWFIAGLALRGYTERLTAAALVATLPQFLFISASINNDNLANLLSALAIFALLRLIRVPNATNTVAFGVALGLALCAKKTALFLVPVALIGFGAVWWRATNRRSSLARLALAPLIAGGLSGWVFVRNACLYGDPLGTAMERRTLAHLVDAKALTDRYWIDTFAPELGRSAIGVFGWMDVPLPGIVPVAYLAAAVISAVGVVCSLRHCRERMAVVFLLLLVGACLAGVVAYNLTYTQYQGRFLFPTVAPLATLCVIGWRETLARLGADRFPAWSVWSLGAALLGVNVYALVMLHGFYTSAEHYVLSTGAGIISR